MLLAIAPTALAQQREPHLGYVCPAGGQQGTTFQVTVGGQSLQDASNVWVTGGGIQAQVVEGPPQLTPKEANELRDRLKKLREQKPAPKDEATRNQIREIARQLARFAKRSVNPAIAETAQVRITVGPDTAPGNRELRLQTPWGVSNPLVFQVGQLPEVRKPELSDEDDPMVPPRRRSDSEPRPVPATETAIKLPATVNGQSLPGGVDRYRFPATAGQTLVIAVSARELIPYLADAVPGWFQATVTLTDAQGHELAFDDDYRFHPDPVLVYRVPRAGEYVLEIRDALYRGREDFVYRLSVGEVPFLAGIFPLGGRTGTTVNVELQGWNLPVATLPINLQDAPPGVRPFTVRQRRLVSNHLPFAVDTLPDCLETEPNNTTENAQSLTPPIIVNGRIDRPGDDDVFRFEGRAGDPVVIEVRARRLDSPLDSAVELLDATGRRVAFNDDHEDKGAGLTTHHADSYLAVTLPAAGRYFVRLRDTQRQGGRACSYRLRLSAPRPDFALRLTPSALNVRPGASARLTVFALRQDGFTNEIALALADAPEGFKLRGDQIPAGQDQAQLTLTAPANAPPAPLRFRVEGRATIAGQAVTHPAVPADDMMQAFAYRHLVPAQELLVAVAGQYRPRTTMKILSATPLKIPAGATARLQVGLPPGAPASAMQVELNQPPDGLTIRSVTPADASLDILLQADAAKLKPGWKGNLVVNAFVMRTPPAEKDKPPPKPRRVLLGALPAVPFEIIAPSP